MYNTTNAFNEAILGDNRKFYSRIKTGNLEITDEIINIKHMMQSHANNVITVGGAFSSYVEIEMWKPDAQIENSEIEVSIGLEVGSVNEIEWVPLGLFTVTKIENDNDIVKFTAYDKIQSKMSNGYFSELSYPTDAKNVLSEIQRKTGVNIDQSNIPDGVMVSKIAIVSEETEDESGNQTTTTTYKNPFDGYTYREALGFIAMLYGKFAVADREGKVKLKWYNQIDYDINTDRYYDDLKIPETVFAVGKISCEGYSQTFESGTGTENIQLSNPVMTQERLNYIYNQIKNLQFLPASTSLYGDIRLDIGDIVTVNSKYGKIIKVPLMNITQEYDGGLLTSIQSYGGTTETEKTQGPTMEKLNRTYEELFFVKEIVGKKADFEYVHGLVGEFDKLSAKQADFENATATNFSSVNAKISTIEAKSITTDNITAEVAKLGYAKVERLEVSEAKISSLETEKISLKDLDAETAKLGYMTVSQADIKFANIDLANVTTANIATLFNKVGLIDRATISEGHITGFLDSVEVNANKITAGTLIADRILLSGSENGILYALNNLGELTSTNVDTLDGGIVTERTLTADKLVAKSITTTELDVETIFGSEAVITKITSQDAFINAVSTNSVVVGADNKAQGIIDNIYTPNTTTIDGGKITANSITADKINVANLFAQDITATGTISGVKLNGATGSFSGKISATTGSIGGWNIGSSSISYSTDDFTVTVAPMTDAHKDFLVVYDKNNKTYPFFVRGDGLHATRGSIGGFTIADDAIFSGTAGMLSDLSGVYVGTDGINNVGTYGKVKIINGRIELNKLLINGNGVGAVAITGWNSVGSALERFEITLDGKATFSKSVDTGTVTSTYSWYGDELSGWYDNIGDGKLYCRYKDGTSANYKYTNIASIMSTLANKANASHTHNGTFVNTSVGFSGNPATLYRKWKDDNNHDILVAGADLLSVAIGWIGSTTYKTIVNLRAQSIRCNGSTSWSSDKNLKNSISDISDRYEQFFDLLNPVVYKYDLGGSGRYHTGYIAQEVKDALEKTGLTTQEFAGFVEFDLSRETETDENGNIVDMANSEANYLLDKGIQKQCNLAYTEFIALNTHMIQKNRNELKRLKNEYQKIESMLQSAYGQIEALREKVHELEMAS